MLWRAKLVQAVVAIDIKEDLRVFLFFVAQEGQGRAFLPIKVPLEGEILPKPCKSGLKSGEC